MNTLYKRTLEQASIDLDDNEDRARLEDIAMHGADAGWSGFTYYSETVEFFRANKSEIIEHATEMADEFGQGLAEFIKGFNCLDSSEDEIGQTIWGHDPDRYVAKALAWFALEETARALTDV